MVICSCKLDPEELIQLSTKMALFMKVISPLYANCDTTVVLYTKIYFQIISQTELS